MDSVTKYIVASFCVCMLILGAASWFALNRVPQEHHWKMQSVVRETVTRGSFFLGTGSIGSEVYYFSYIKGKNGASYIKGFPASCTAIYEDADCADAAYVRFRTSYSLWRDWLGTSIPQHNPYEYETTMRCSGSVAGPWSYQLHVPHDTIMKEFRLQ